MAIKLDQPFTKVISVTTETDVPRNYFGSNGAAGKWYPSGKDDSGNYNQFLLIIGGDSYQFLWTDLEIEGNTPASFSDANNLLGTLFQSL